MFVTYDSMQDLLDLVNRDATKHRDAQARVKTEKDKNAHATAAMALESIAMMIENSNLMRCRIIWVDDDIDDAIKELEHVEVTLRTGAESLTQDADAIKNHILDLRDVKAGKEPVDG